MIDCDQLSGPDHPEESDSGKPVPDPWDVQDDEDTLRRDENAERWEKNHA